MAEVQIAHLNIQNVNVIVTFLNEQFDHKTEGEQDAVHEELQMRASNAGLAGNVVLVWTDAFGRMKFRAPQNQHPYFKSVSYQHLAAQINRKLSWN